MRKILLIALLLISCRVLFAQCDNRALNFDGVGDFISLSTFPATFLPNSEYSVQMWFRSSATDGNTNCLGSFRCLFDMESGNIRSAVGECGGLLHLNLNGSLNLLSSTSIRDGNWHNIALTRSGGNIAVYLDCTLVFSGVYITIGMNPARFNVGHRFGGPTPGEDWQGEVDEIRLWDRALNPGYFTSCSKCQLNPQERYLVLNWNLDQGVPQQLNTDTEAEDGANNGNNGTLNGFSLLPGAVSNFVCSDIALVYPNLAHSEVEFRGLLPNFSGLITEICSGDPVHFCLKKDGVIPAPPPNMTIQWQFSNNGGTWTTITDPAYTGFCFVVPSVETNCSAANLDGFVDRRFRAMISVNDPVLGTCTYNSGEYTLRICCPISPATVQVDVMPADSLNGTLCAGDLVDFNVSLNSPDPFVTNPGAATTIQWFQNNVHEVAWDNLTSFTATGVTVGGPSICFRAEVMHCAKTATFSSCIKVDSMPECGKIIRDPLCTTLGPSLTPCPPGLTCYSICPGNDASLAIFTPSQFAHCTPQWQYSFDQINWTPLVNLGFSNSLQNTNELPGDWPWPPGFPPIYYRIACMPLSSPSGCEPCFSNTIRIELLSPPPADVIVGLTQVCASDGPYLLSVANPGPYTYTWYHDGLEVQNGSSPDYLATKSGCYWVDISNGCQVTQTPRHCLEFCELVAAISCPLAPNECALLGMPITVDACIGTKFSCGTAPLNTFIYDWSWTDVSGTNFDNGVGVCSVTHTPPPSGTTFTVTVTDPDLGCTDTATITVVPCDHP